MHYCSDKDINRIVKELVRTGWRFEQGRHGKLRHPSGVGFSPESLAIIAQNLAFAELDYPIAVSSSRYHRLIRIQRDIRQGGSMSGRRPFTQRLIQPRIVEQNIPQPILHLR
jgi:hypothetical protein